jgi:hypothetical protein
MRIIFIFLLLFFTANIHAQVVDVSAYGVQPNTFADATEGVKQAIAACKNKQATRLVFPQGRYDFYPEKAEKREYFISNTSSEKECPSKIKNIGLLFEEVNNLRIEGNGSLFVFHGKTVMWAFDRCENIQLTDVTLDYVRPTISELTFLEVQPDYVIAAVHPDSKYAIIQDKLQFYGDNWKMYSSFSILTDTLDGAELYSSFDPLWHSKATELALNKLRFDGDFRHINYKAGKNLTVRDPYRDHVGAFINRSKNVSLTNVTLHFMHGLGIVSQFSENLNYTGVRIIPWRGRTIASFADGMHFSGCRGYIKVDSCRFKGLHDDPMNVHGTYLKITEIHSDNRLTLRFMHDQTYGFPAFFEGDTVAFIHSGSLQKRGMATVRKATLVSKTDMQIELSAPLPPNTGIGDCLENLTWTPSLEVRNSLFEMTNTRGLLITTPRKVVVSGNRFYRTGMYAIQIAGDAGSWYESGAVQDVLIQNNLFEECGYNHGDEDSYSIAVNPEDHELNKGQYVHRNIRITGNTFKTIDGLVLKAKSADGLLFENNIIEPSSWIPPQYRPDAIKSSAEPFKIEHCKNVRIKN